MTRTQLNETFDLGEDYNSGYFSDTRITDIKDKYIGSVVDLDALTKISRQLDVSMGSMMGMVNGFAIVIYMVLIYLLSKIIIEKNAQSISMVKILGYTNGEISCSVFCFFNGSSALSACQSSNRNGGYEGSVQGDDAVKHFRLDYALDRPDDLCADVCSRNHYIRNRCFAGISESEEGSYG